MCRKLFSGYNQRRKCICASFIVGYSLGEAYYYYMLKKIPFPYQIEWYLSIGISLLLAIGNAISVQIRCICLLIFPMYCGKSGRGVLKAVVLTYVVAGPITNMGQNAKEVVRVFACSTVLSFNLSKEYHELLADPFKTTALDLECEIDQLKDAFRSIRDIVGPIENEVEDNEEVAIRRKQNDYLDTLLKMHCRSHIIERKYRLDRNMKSANRFLNHYYKKMEYRCQYQLTHAVSVCVDVFSYAYDDCLSRTAYFLCWPLKVNNVCNFLHIINQNGTCNIAKEKNPGFGEGYAALIRFKNNILNGMNDMKLLYKITYERSLYDVQDAKETGERVMHAFEEKMIVMRAVIVALNVCMALLFFRIVFAAVAYHDLYLTCIEYDNIYVTSYFKKLDFRRKRRGEMTLLPLKKMERNKYIDVHSLTYKAPLHTKLVTQVLKVMLEVVTATTFVMLDRLFYEALDVVRQHAQLDNFLHQDVEDLSIQVDGTGMLSSILRKLLSRLDFNREISKRPEATNADCLPHPRAMPNIYFFKIYGGYVWILLLLAINPYTLRFRRVICSYFYPVREKQRILHLYNDILKKRMKMQKTLRRKAVQAVRAHYLSGENLLSLRMKFPYLLGWLHTLPAARMTCLICGETEPRLGKYTSDCWQSCYAPKCPFVYCGECWKEAGEHCLACDPSLIDLSDVDSLSDEEQQQY